MISNMLRFHPSLFDGLEEILSPEFSAFSPVKNRARSYPLVNMGMTDNSVEIYLFVPGAEASSLDVSLEKNLLTVAGESAEREVKEGETVNRRERFQGRFKRVITLPDDVDPEKVDARYRDGVLQISVAKREETQPRQIEVKV